MFEKGFVSKATRVSEELNLKKAQFALEQAQCKKKVLVEYTKRQDDQGARERGREGPRRRAGQEGGLGAGGGQGGRAGASARSHLNLDAGRIDATLSPADPFGFDGASAPGSRVGRISRTGQRKPGMTSSPESSSSSCKRLTEPSPR